MKGTVIWFGCRRCGHKWIPNKPQQRPRRCARCQRDFSGKHRGDFVVLREEAEIAAAAPKASGASDAPPQQQD